MSKLIILALSLGMTACIQSEPHEPERLEGMDTIAAAADARRYLGEGARILAVCGPSKGVGLYLDEYDDGYSPDGIDEGVIVFAFGADGKPEIVHRDALKEMVVMSENGANISVVSDPRDKRLGVWIAQFPTSGIVETHNLAIDPNSQLLNLWTSNKPTFMISARSLAFHSKCEFQA